MHVSLLMIKVQIKAAEISVVVVLFFVFFGGGIEPVHTIQNIMEFAL